MGVVTEGYLYSSPPPPNVDTVRKSVGIAWTGPNIRKGMSGLYITGLDNVCAARTLPWKMIIWHLICHFLSLLSFVIWPPPTSLDCVAGRRYASYLILAENSRSHNIPSRIVIFFLIVFLMIDISIFLWLHFSSIDIWRLLSFSAPKSGQKVDRARHNP